MRLSSVSRGDIIFSENLIPLEDAPVHTFLAFLPLELLLAGFLTNLSQSLQCVGLPDVLILQERGPNDVSHLAVVVRKEFFVLPLLRDVALKRGLDGETIHDSKLSKEDNSGCAHL